MENRLTIDEESADSKRRSFGGLGRFGIWLVAGGLLLVGIWGLMVRSHAGPQVVVYTALDQDFSEPVFEEFTRQTGIAVLAKFDTESTKTVGLTQAIFAERDRPRCDVFWNNEIVNTLRLDQAGLLGQYQILAESPFPEQYRSSRGAWFGFAARARVLIVNTELVPEEDIPKSIADLTDPKWQGKVGIAKPLAGTTASHAACLFAVWGDERAEEFFLAIKNNVRVMAGNKQVAISVAAGELAFGLTDTDDAIIEREQGRPVTIVYPDQGEEGLGTLFIPNTVAIIKDAPHRKEAEKLVDYLLSAPVEEMLAAGPSAQIPLNKTIDKRLRVESPQTIRAMQVDFEEAAARWDHVAAFLREKFASED
ncbi:MAG: extracellular solute-binding protein [Planctomycetales bacterium]|nr:extracellular solute-binding protein [Planctomycetales bacterium]